MLCDPTHCILYRIQIEGEDFEKWGGYLARFEADKFNTKVRNMQSSTVERALSFRHIKWIHIEMINIWAADLC